MLRIAPAILSQPAALLFEKAIVLEPALTALSPIAMAFVPVALGWAVGLDSFAVYKSAPPPPPAGVANEITPEPLVVKTCPLEPSTLGRV